VCDYEYDNEIIEYPHANKDDDYLDNNMNVRNTDLNSNVYQKHIDYGECEDKKDDKNAIGGRKTNKS
jgi:hypothetical protein